MRMYLEFVLCSVFGASVSAQTQVLMHVGDAAGDQFGSALAALDDIDGDGRTDLAIGAPLADVTANNAGMARVYSGRTLQVLHTWRGASANENLGCAIAAAGDVDGDGRGDVIVGASGAIGRAVVYSGATGLAVRTLVGGVGRAFGNAVAGNGLVDGDLVPDQLVGEPYQNIGGQYRGRVYVFSGANGALLRTHDGVLDYGTSGWSVAFLGDVNGDGRDEYVVGAPAAQNNFVQPRVTAFDGASGVELWTHNATSLSDEFGWALAPISDVSGDGKRDLLVGAMQDAGIGCACSGWGFVRALNGVNGAQLYQVSNTSGLYTGFGWAVSAVGDLNANGFEDFAASRPGSEGCGGSGAHEVQLRDGQSGALISMITPPAGSEGFGTALAFGDTNGDGLRDLVCASPCTNSSGSFAGRVDAYTIVRAPTGYCVSEMNSLGCTPAIAGVGTPSATSASVFEARAVNMLNNANGLLFYSFTPRQTPFQGGHMCVVAPIVRTALQNSGGHALPVVDCSGVFSIDFNARIRSGADPLLVVGEEVFAQYWSRDPADASTTNLTGALAFYVNP